MERVVKACLFDIDGTLISTGGAGREAMHAALAEVFGVARPIEPHQISGRTDRGIARDQFRLNGIEETDNNWWRLVAGYLRHLPAKLEFYRGRLLPGVAELLDHLADRSDVAVGLLTGNLADGARVKLDHFGVYHHFAFGAFGDEHFCRDELAREALTTLHGRLGDIPGDHIWVVGDTPLDIQCARAIGAKVLAVATGIHSADELADAGPDELMHDLSNWRQSAAWRV